MQQQQQRLSADFSAQSGPAASIPPSPTTQRNPQQSLLTSPHRQGVPNMVGNPMGGPRPPLGIPPQGISQQQQPPASLPPGPQFRLQRPLNQQQQQQPPQHQQPPQQHQQMRFPSSELKRELTSPNPSTGPRPPPLLRMPAKTPMSPNQTPSPRITSPTFNSPQYRYQTPNSVNQAVPGTASQGGATPSSMPMQQSIPPTPPVVNPEGPMKRYVEIGSVELTLYCNQ